MSEPPRDDEGGEAARDGVEAAIDREARRLCQRYVDEVVLGFGLCPWAAPTLASGRFAIAVSRLGDAGLQATRVSPPDEAHAFVDELVTRDADIGFLLFPRVQVGRAAFDAFAERVRRAERARSGPDTPPPYLLAAFHPDGEAVFSPPPRLISFLRRTPDPMLQFVRASAIDRVHASRPQVSDEVAAANWKTLSPDAGAKLAALVRELRADRDATYARLRAARS